MNFFEAVAGDVDHVNQRGSRVSKSPESFQGQKIRDKIPQTFMSFSTSECKSHSRCSVPLCTVANADVHITSTRPTL